jgi:hypothetical protein
LSKLFDSAKVQLSTFVLPSNKVERQAGKLWCVYLPVIVRLAVEFGVATVAGVAEEDPALAAGQAVLVPARVSHPHQETIVDLLPTAFTHFVRFLALDRSGGPNGTSDTTAATSCSSACSTHLCVRKIILGF